MTEWQQLVRALYRLVHRNKTMEELIQRNSTFLATFFVLPITCTTGPLPPPQPEPEPATLLLPNKTICLNNQLFLNKMEEAPNFVNSTHTNVLLILARMKGGYHEGMHFFCLNFVWRWRKREYQEWQRKGSEEKKFSSLFYLVIKFQKFNNTINVLINTINYFLENRLLLSTPLTQL